MSERGPGMEGLGTLLLILGALRYRLTQVRGFVKMALAANLEFPSSSSSCGAPG